MKIRFWVISLLVICILFLSGCKSNEKFDAPNIKPLVNLDNNSASEDMSETNKQSEMKSLTTEKTSIKDVECRFYFLAMTELKYYYIKNNTCRG